MGSSLGDWGWTKVSDFTFATGLDDFEARGNVVAVVPSPAMYLEISDWMGGQDAVGIGTRSGTRGAPLLTGPHAGFVKADTGVYAYRSTGTSFEAYARAGRGSENELTLRYGSLFMGWKTTGLGGIDRLEAPGIASVRSAGRDLAVGGWPGAWEQYETSALSVKHNIWLEAPLSTSSPL